MGTVVRHIRARKSGAIWALKSKINRLKAVNKEEYS